ncbi:putative leucine-rich repeat-containing protein DDB_G0290503 [Aphidius gifuensis]|uniref:putative leucine-rich repeat-containing protein DDB_G0290503 n=1 Tax=Aphidius gifuensis TaxID=684658 RepID=UPI001CDBE9A1|nr:putative leucine-rich repeat-containing protein DDB_G0290503 [Aphidius gifuensis]
MEPIDKHQFEKTDQQLFTASFNVCWEILKRKEYYLCEHDTNIFSRLSLNYGQDMYDAMMIIMNKIIKSNEHKVEVAKSKVESIEIVTTEATRDSGYEDNYDRSNQQQQKRVDKVNIDIKNSQDKMISKKRKISVDEIHSKKIFEADNKKNNCDDPSYAQNIEIASLNENSIEKLHMIDLIEKEEELFRKESITIKDEMLPVTDNSIDVDKMNDSNGHLIGLEIKPNEISNFFKDDNQSYSNESIENVDHQKKTRIRTGSLASKKYIFYTEEDDELSSTTDENDLDEDNIDADDDDDGKSLNQNKNLEGKIRIVDDISFEEKTRVVELAIKHPNWSIDMLKEQSGYKNIYNRSQVEKWEKHIKQGGSPHKVAVESIKIVTAEATRDLGYDDNYDQLNQKQQQVDKVNIDINDNQNKMVLNKRKISVDEFHSEKMFKAGSFYFADNNKNNCDDSSCSQNIQIASTNENLVEKLHMVDFIKKEESITIKDELLSITDDSIDGEKMNNSIEHSIRLEIKSNEITNFSKDNNPNCLNGSIENVDHKKKTRFRTGSLAPKKCRCCEQKNDDLSSIKVPRKFDSTSVQYDDEDNDTKKITNSNKDKVAVKKSKVGSIKSATTEVTRDSGYDDSHNQLNQQKQVDKVNIDIYNSRDSKTISEKRKIPVDAIHSKNMFKADTLKKKILKFNSTPVNYEDDDNKNSSSSRDSRGPIISAEFFTG